MSLRQFEKEPEITFSNVTRSRYEAIHHWVFYRLEIVCHKCLSSVIPFPYINVIPRSISVNVKFCIIK